MTSGTSVTSDELLPVTGVSVGLWPWAGLGLILAGGGILLLRRELFARTMS